MPQADLFYRFGAALAMGLLIGLQREHAFSGPERQSFAGVRTFPLMALVGCGAALAADALQAPWIFVGLVLPVGALIAIAYAASAWQGDLGLTTEMSAWLTIVIGALCYWGYLTLAAALTVTVLALLALKIEMHAFVRHITRADIYATLKFAALTAIVLPLLPNRPLGPPPFDVLNPYRLWLMVVFISGISFLGYVLIKLRGPRQGIGLTGLLGGVVSSTAVTLNLTQRSHKQAALARSFALAIIVSWTVMYARVGVAVAVLNLPLLHSLWLPLAVPGVAGLAYGVFLYVARRETETVEFDNPFELRPALQFGLLYALILLGANMAQQALGDAGLYLSSVVAGLADLNAITLTVADLSQPVGSLDRATATRAIVLAAMSNTVVKGLVVLTGGAPALRRALLPGLLLVLLSAAVAAFFLA